MAPRFKAGDRVRLKLSHQTRFIHRVDPRTNLAIQGGQYYGTVLGPGPNDMAVEVLWDPVYMRPPLPKIHGNSGLQKVETDFKSTAKDPFPDLHEQENNIISFLQRIKSRKTRKSIRRRAKSRKSRLMIR